MLNWCLDFLIILKYVEIKTCLLKMKLTWLMVTFWGLRIVRSSCCEVWGGWFGIKSNAIFLLQRMKVLVLVELQRVDGDKLIIHNIFLRFWKVFDATTRNKLYIVMNLQFWTLSNKYISPLRVGDQTTTANYKRGLMKVT